jgi:hypothetical protein
VYFKKPSQSKQSPVERKFAKSGHTAAGIRPNPAKNVHFSGPPTSVEASSKKHYETGRCIRFTSSFFDSKEI